MSQDLEEKEMVSIPIGEFLAADVLPVDLYIRINEEKYVLIAKREQKSAQSQLIGLEAKNVTHLHVRQSEYNSYVSSSVLFAGVVISQKELDNSKKAEYLTHAGTATLKEIECLGLNGEAYEHARLTASSTTIFVESKPDIYGLLNALTKVSEATMAHSIACSVISVMIGKALGWTKPLTLEKLALGGLLHDVGLKEIPNEILLKPRAELTLEELQLYETHPFRSMEILRSIPSAPDDIIAIAYEHHENALGLGYPRKLRELRMHPMAKVVSLADAFCELTLRTNPNIPAMSPQEALTQIEITMGQPFSRDCFSALKLLIRKDLKLTA